MKKPKWYKQWEEEFLEAVEDYIDLMTFFYLDYANFPGEKYDFEAFKKSILRITEQNLNWLHEKYADHLEGISRDN